VFVLILILCLAFVGVAITFYFTTTHLLKLGDRVTTLEAKNAENPTVEARKWAEQYYKEQSEIR